LAKIKNKKKDNLKKELTEVLINDVEEIVTKSKKLYEKGYSGLDIIELIEHNYSLFPNMNKERQCELLVAFNKVRKEIKNEKLLMLFILNFVYLDKAMTLENISFF
jgi:hypothetical protein